MENNKVRLDIYVSQKLNISRSEAQKLIDNNCVSNKQKILNKRNLMVDIDNNGIVINNNLNNESKAKENILTPYKHNLDIVYQDDYLLIINKESGMIIHPTSFNEQNTVANIVKYYIDNKLIKSSIKQDNRMGICHRLDKDTSGLLVIAKDNKTFEKMSKMFKENNVKKIYTCLLFGVMESKQIDVDAPIKRVDGSNKREVSSDFDAKDAFTTFTLIKAYEKFSVVEANIKTGRTHQIRVHAKYIKHNVINDPLYGLTNKTTKYGQYLVANKIEFIHPITNKLVSVKIDLPNEFIKYIKENGD